MFDAVVWVQMHSAKNTSKSHRISVLWGLVEGVLENSPATEVLVVSESPGDTFFGCAMVW